MKAIQVPHPIEVLHSGEVALACGLDGQIFSDQLHGLFAGDTRVLSTYRLSLGGYAWNVLSRTRPGWATARWEMQNPRIRGGPLEIPGGALLLSLRRRVDGGVHDDLEIQSFVDREFRVRLTLQLDADFSDIFEVRDQTIRPRLGVSRVATREGLDFRYRRGDYRRALRVVFRPQKKGPAPAFVGTLIVFDLTVGPGFRWGCCLEAIPEVGRRTLGFRRHPHEPEGDTAYGATPLLISGDPLLVGPLEQGRRDLRALSVEQKDSEPFVAAGAPWFLTLFGRDSLLVGLMTSLDGAWAARGALDALEPLQARSRDDWRDAEPGKILHELRIGELARFGEIPHSPYYGTSDAPALFCLALWNAWRWTGDEGLVSRHLDAAIRALEWCERFGDRDGDGFIEYGTRSPKGYRNQGWKDAGDAILHADGSQPEQPVAVVELQGYWFAALLAMAELLAHLGREDEAGRLSERAERLRRDVESRYWMEEARTYALALDGRKRQVTSIASNPAHLLWCGLPAFSRARSIATRLLRKDLFSGWGLRSLSAEHPAYNPLSYQRGTVWPHDTLLAAGGLRRYGCFEESDRLIRSVLDAASFLEQQRLPELYCGFDREHGAPVPYLRANSPQAWAAAAPLLAAQLFAGIVPDVPRGIVHLRPRLPSWLDRLELDGVLLGNFRLSLSLSGSGEKTIIRRVDCPGLEISRELPEAALWGAPPSGREAFEDQIRRAR